MKPRILLNAKQLDLTLRRLSFELIENHQSFSDTVIIGIQPRGVQLSRRLHHALQTFLNNQKIEYGELDITFYRDDFRRRNEPISASRSQINFLVEGKNVILVDDVLYTGRTIRSALDALLDYGRPKSVELCVLVDRRFSRHLPIQADYIGNIVDSIDSERVKVHWKEEDGKDQVTLYTLNETHE